jgi:diketogulonate reductase-like aldo/keto reductase
LKTFHNILEEPTVAEIAKRHNKSAAQVLLRHLLQNDIAVIPKSSNPARIEENFDVFDFELTKDEMDSIDALDKDENGRTIDFSFWSGSETHPCFPFTKK